MRTGKKQKNKRRELTIQGEKGKLPIKAEKERAADFGWQRRGGGCEPREESVCCSSGIEKIRIFVFFFTFIKKRFKYNQHNCK